MRVCFDTQKKLYREKQKKINKDRNEYKEQVINNKILCQIYMEKNQPTIIEQYYTKRILTVQLTTFCKV